MLIIVCYILRSTYLSLFMSLCLTSLCHANFAFNIVEFRVKILELLPRFARPVLCGFWFLSQDKFRAHVQEILPRFPRPGYFLAFESCFGSRSPQIPSIWHFYRSTILNIRILTVQKSFNVLSFLKYILYIPEHARPGGRAKQTWKTI